ncbi:MAG: DUF192 domain-containing protein [candidate division NC10 bacterium]|nr:DUF192 domain-containing protein [candidate division NC10 bacterium]
MTGTGAIRTRLILRLMLPLALLHYAVEPPAALALQKGEVVIDGRVAINVEVARSPQAQTRGLGGRPSLKKGTGMVFPYDGPGPRGIWMKGMRIPIDILWIREGRIVAIEAKVPPPSSNGALAVFSHVADLVLEVPAGYAKEMGIRVGQSVRVTHK